MSDSDDEEASIDKKLSDFPPDLRSPDGNENPQQSASSSSESSDDSEESSSESEESDSSACSNNSTPEVTAKTTTQSWGLANFMDKKSSPALALGNSLSAELSQLPGGEKNGDSLVDDDSVNCILSKYPSHDIKEYLKSSSPEFLELEPPSKGFGGAFHGLAPFSPPPPSPDVQQLVGCSPLSRADDEEDSRSSLHSKWSSHEGKGKSRNRLFFNGSNSERQFGEVKATPSNTSKPFQEACSSSPKVVAARSSPDTLLPVPSSPKSSSKHKRSRTTESSEKRPKKSESKTRDSDHSEKSNAKKKDLKAASSDGVAVKESRNTEKHKAKAPVPPPPTVEKHPVEPFSGKRLPVAKQLKIKSREYVDSSDSDSDVDVVGCSREESSREGKCHVLPKPKVVTPPVPAPPVPPRKLKSKSKDRIKPSTTGEKHKSSMRSSLGLLNNLVLYPTAVEVTEASLPPKMLSPLPRDEAEHKENDVPSVMVSIELALLKRVPPYPPKLGILRPEDSIIRQRTECGAVTSSRGHLKEINREKAPAVQAPRTPKRKSQQEKKGHHKRPKLLTKKETKIKEEDLQPPKMELKPLLERCDSTSSLCSMGSLKEPIVKDPSLKEPKIRRSVTPSSGSQKPAKVHREDSLDRKRKFRKETVGEERPAKAPTYKESPAAAVDCEPSSQDMQWDNQSIKSEVTSQNGDGICDVNDVREHSRDWDPMPKVDHKSQLEYDTRQKNSDYYLIEAKKLKHKADREVDRTDQVMKYLEAVLYFILTGNAMENTRVDTDKIYTMYKETLHLIKYISSKFHKLLNSSAGSIDNKLAILSLRCQSLLYLKLYNLRQKDIKDIQKNLSDYQKTTAGKTSSHRSPLPPNHGVAPGRLKQPSPCQPSSRNGVPSPHSPTPSPAGSVASVGSQSSGYSSSELNGTQQSRVLPPGGGVPLSSAPPVVLPVISSSSQPMVTIPQNIYVMFQRQQAFMANLSLCHELWEQADRLVSRIHVKDFFVKLDEQCGRLSLHSSFSELVHYVRRGLYLLKDNT